MEAEVEEAIRALNGDFCRDCIFRIDYLIAFESCVHDSLDKEWYQKKIPNEKWCSNFAKRPRKLQELMDSTPFVLNDMMQAAGNLQIMKAFVKESL